MLTLQLVVGLGLAQVNFMTINFNVLFIKFTSKAIAILSSPLSKCKVHGDCLTDNFKQANLELSPLNRDLTF